MRRLASLLLLLLAVPAWASSPAEAVAAARADAQRLSPEEARQTRYLWRANAPAAEWDEFRRVLAGQVNQVSRRARLVAPRDVSAELLAVRLDHYGWQRETWESLAKIDPYFHETLEVVEAVEEDRESGNWWLNGTKVDAGTPGAVWKTARVVKVKAEKKVRKAAAARWLDPSDSASLILLTGSEAAVVRADWWFAQSARQVNLRNKQTGAGYYDWLQLKKRDDLFKLVKFDEAASKEFDREVRAAVDKSGVSQVNRQIVRFQALGGGIWITLDTDDDSDAGNAVDNLVPGAFKHKAEEIYAALPNGLPAYWAGDDKGGRQDSAPDFISDNDPPGREGRDGRIHVCLACVQCHEAKVLKPIDDYVRRTYSAKGPVRLDSPDLKTAEELQRVYFSNLDKSLARDRADFTDSIKEATGLSPGEFARGFGAAWNRYAVRPVSREGAARESGVAPARLKAALVAYDAAVIDVNGKPKLKGVPPQIAPYLLDNGDGLPRTYWENSFGLVQLILRAHP